MVELTRATSDTPSETDKIGDNSVSTQKNTTSTKSELQEDAAFISEEWRAGTHDAMDSSLVIGTTERLKVTHVESPKEVYFTKSSDKESFCKLYELIAKEVEGLEGTADLQPAVGSLVLGRASDRIWYRGKVMSSEGSSHLLFFAVDFGFTEKVKRKQIREIPETLSSLKTHHYLGKIFKDYRSAARAFCFQLLSVRCWAGRREVRPTPRPSWRRSRRSCQSQPGSSGSNYYSKFIL